MTNSEAINILKEQIELSNEMMTKPFFQDAQETIKKTIEAYKAAIKALEYDWTPVSERLPEDGEDIIVTYIDDEETRIIPVNYDKGTWYDCIFDTALNPIKVIAWMPKPKPWKGDKIE